MIDELSFLHLSNEQQCGHIPTCDPNPTIVPKLHNMYTSTVPMQKGATIISGSNKLCTTDNARGDKYCKNRFALEKLFLNDTLKYADRIQPVRKNKVGLGGFHLHFETMLKKHGCTDHINDDKRQSLH